MQTGKELEEELPICRVQTKEQNIALTFEVTYETDQVSEILELLAQHGGGASFFVTGKWAAEHTELAERILEQGCDVGFLGYECHDMSLLKETEAREELGAGKGTADTASADSRCGAKTSFPSALRGSQ